MINFFVPGAATHCIRDYLRGRGQPIAEQVHVVEHDRLGSLTRLPLGGTIFAALDQTSAAASAACAVIYDHLASASPPVAVLNDPRKVLRRFELLTRLHQSGCNRFRVIRALDDPRGLRYPVFIRPEHRHDGSLTPLLRDRRSLDRTLGELMFRGITLSDLLIVEFCDTSDASGVYRKYSAMRIGDVILPRHLHVSGDWVTKSENSFRNESFIREELAYLEEHPHERWLRQVFDLAHIEYGRIDYGMYRGEPQVWEINMNPTIGRNAARPTRPDADRHRHLQEPGRAVSHQQMLEAFRRIDASTPSRELDIVIDPALRARLDVEAAQASRQSRAAAVTDRVARHPRIRRLVKNAIFTAAGPVAPVLAEVMRRRHRHRVAGQGE
nr:hypothetical protein [uncultured bacterium]